jgi:hypothetical protein
MNKYLKILISVIIFILFSLKLSAQNWPKIFTLNKITLSRDLIQDYDDGSLILGYESSNSSFSGYGFLIKTDVNGETLWMKLFGTDDYYVGFNDVKKTSDNGYLLSGWTDKRLADDWDPLYIKLNTCGEIEWCTILNSELGEGWDYGVDAVELADGSIIGQLKYYGNQIQTIRISLVKMDNYGNPLWIEHLAQNDSTIINEEGYELLLTADSSLLITADLVSCPFFIKTDLLANELWTHKWIDEGGSHGISLNSMEDKYGNFYSTGNLNNTNHPRPGPVILKTDQNGNQLYSKIILGDTVMRGGSGPFKIYNDSLLIMGGGWSPVNHPIQEGYISVFVTDTLGNLLNMRNLISYFNGPNGLEITNDNKIVSSGSFYEAGKVKTFLWKLNMQLEDDSINNNTIIYDSLCNHTILTDTLDINCDVFVNIGELPTQQEYNNPIKIWPNPTHEKTFIEVPYTSGSIIRIFNNSAIMVKELKVPINGILEINTINWSKGFYFVCLLNSETKIHVKKFIVN